MSKIISLLFMIGMVSTLFSQNEQPNYHSANKLRIAFGNDGTIGNTGEINAEWPIATGHEYLDLAYPVIAVEANGSAVVARFIPSSGFSAEADVVAMNHLPGTFPAAWPDRPSSWAGHWNGFLGRGQLTADQESLIALEDNNLGLQLLVRGWQWSSFLAQDMIVLHYELSNTGSMAYERAVAGFFARPNPGGEGDVDQQVFDQQRGQVTAIDMDDEGTGSGIAQNIGDWSPVGRFSVAMLETPSLENDGIDNDGDGMVDESRSDGIDNDGDWQAFSDLDGNGTWDPETEPLNDDLGADGAPLTGDEGEADALPTDGEPNFDASDAEESDQVGFGSFASFDAGGFEAANPEAVWNAMTPGRLDTPADEFVLGSGYFSLAPGETQRFSVILYMSANELDQRRNEQTIDALYADSYRFPVAPPAPIVNSVARNNSVTLYWGTRSENEPDFEGYKIYRSSDPGFNDVFTVTDDKGVLIYDDPIATVDIKNGYEDFFALNAFGFSYFLGNNNGVVRSFTDNDVINGKTYYYAVTAFDHGNDTLRYYPAESTKSIVVKRSGEIVTDVNTVRITPVVEARGYHDPEVALAHNAGGGTGEVFFDTIDRRQIQNSQYELTFDTTGGESRYSLFDVSDAQNPLAIFENSTNFSRPNQRNAGDPIFDGLRIFVVNDPLRWDSVGTNWQSGNSNWRMRLDLNNNLGDAIPVAADYEVRFGEVGIDTAIFTTPIPVPFQVWNTTDNVKENILLLDQDGDLAWSSGEAIFVVEGDDVQNFRPIFWAITFTAPEDTLIASRPPVSGDVAFLPTRKPFAPSDVYTISTTGASLDGNLSPSVLEDIRVVPNPYIVNSGFEQRSMYTGGIASRKLQFTNLPQKCTIRIYNLRGIFIDEIEHTGDIDNGSEFWDLQTLVNAKTVAFGIYIYHVDAPGIGERTGRFAVIR